MRVTDKTPDELEFLAVWKNGSEVIHVISIPENNGWVQGDPCLTLCGRKISEAMISADVVEGDRPCKICDKKTSVAVVMFETAEIIGGLMRRWQDHYIQAEMILWMNHGIENGYISPPFCYFHFGSPPLSDLELAAFDSGEEICVMVMRLDPFNHLDSFDDLVQ